MSSNLEPDAFDVLTFDCYGTLVDWVGGVRVAVSACASLAGCDVDRFLVERGKADSALITGPYLCYREVLAESMRRAARAQGREVSSDEARAFAESMAAWQPFPESRRALERLASKYRLVILSNVETDILEASIEALGVPFDGFVTAQQIESYKPARKHFDECLARFDLRAERVLHVARSLFHDIRPSQALGWSNVWIDRKDGPEPERLPDDLRPTLVTPDLTTLADRLGCAG